MKQTLFWVSLIFVIAFGPQLMALNSNTAADDKQSETQEQPLEDVKDETLEAEKEPSSEVKQPSSEVKQPTKSRASSRNNKAPNKVFIPTEEISEDKPVAFPVDI